MGSSTELAIVLTAKDAASSVLSGISQKFNGLGSAAKLGAAGVASLAAAATTVVGTLMASANKTVAYAGEVKKLSRELGLGAAEASRLSYAGQRLGLDTEELSKSFGVLAKEIHSGGEKLGELGVKVVKAKDGNVDFTATLGNIADKFKAMPDGVDKTALSMDLFGKTGKDLIPFLNKGRDGLKELGDKAESLGLVLDQNTIAAASRFKGAQKDLGEAVEGVTNKIGVAFLPILADLATKFVGLVDKTMPTVVKGLDFIRDAVTLAGGAVLEKLTPVWDGVSEKARLAFGLITDTVRSFRTGDLGLLVGAIQETFGVRLSEPVRAFIGTIFTELRKIPGFLGQVAGSLGEMFDVLSGRRPDAGGVLRSLVGDKDAERIAGVLGGVREAMTLAWTEISEALAQVWEVMKPKLDGFIGKLDDLRDRFAQLPEPLKRWVEATAVAGVAVKATGLDETLSNIGSAVGSLISGFAGLASVIFQKGGLKLALGAAAAAFGAAVLPVVVFGGIIVGLGLIFLNWSTIVKNVQADIEAWGRIFSALGTKVREVTDRITSVVGEFFGFWIDAWTKITTEPQVYLARLIGWIAGALAKLVGNFFEALGTITHNVLEWIGGVKTSIWDFFTALPGNIWTWLLETVDKFGEFKTAAGNVVGSAVERIWGVFSAFFTGSGDSGGEGGAAVNGQSLGDRLMQFGIDAVQGFWDGLVQKWSDVTSWVGTTVANFIAGFREGFKSHSPSLVMAGIGTDVVDGFIQGIRARQAASLTALSAWIDPLKEMLSRELAQAQTMVATIGRHFAPGVSAEMQRTIGTTQLLAQATNGAGSVSAAQLRNGPRFIHVDPLTGNPIPIFHQGGVMPWDGLALLERGERITAARGARGGGSLESATILNRIYLDGRVLAEVLNDYTARRSTQVGGGLE